MLLGLCGAAGCGKDTLAYEMVIHDAYEQYRFADPIKNMLRQFHIHDDVWDDHDRKEKDIPWLGRSPRYLAQTLGTEWGRNLVNPDIWLLLAQGRWHHVNAEGKGRLVISDVRFENEAKWIKDAGGLVIKIHRGTRHLPDNHEHVSESGIPIKLIDDHVYNNDSAKAMYDKFWERVHVQVQ